MYICNSTKNINTRDIPQKFDPGETLVSVGAYCLMPNHFHILVKEKTEGGISKYLQKLSTAYVMYYNKKYKTSGSLFEGKFKSRYVDSDHYLRYLFSYIHLNPVKLIDTTWKEKGLKNMAKSFDFLNDYHYSSYQSYLKDRPDMILAKKEFPPYFKNALDHQKELVSWLSFNQNP